MTEVAAVRNAIASARLEGVELDEATIERLRQVAAGTLTADDAVAAIVADDDRGRTKKPSGT